MTYDEWLDEIDATDATRYGVFGRWLDVGCLVACAVVVVGAVGFLMVAVGRWLA